MRLDHIAYRTKDRNVTANFFINALGYKIQTEFEINFDNGSKAKCIALEPPEKTNSQTINIELPDVSINNWNICCKLLEPNVTYHLAPEIFVSDGDLDSVVGRWVAHRDGIGGIHHLAYQVDSVQKVMDEWREKGYAEFTTESPLTCPGLTQVFTKPSELTGVIYEFIERGEQGFCKENVKNLMVSTDNLK